MVASVGHLPIDIPSSMPAQPMETAEAAQTDHSGHEYKLIK